MRLVRLVLAILLATLASACARGPDEAGLSNDVQQRLDTLFGGQVLMLRSLNRQGSAPVAAAGDGARQVIVYFNARLEFAEAYDPSDWEGISPQLLAAALGATDAGITFLSGGRMVPGTELLAHGSLVYRREGDQWRPTDPGLPQPAAAKQAATGASDTRTGELIRRLAQLVDTSPVPREMRERVVAEELDRALQNIQLRLDAGSRAIVVATGPQDGEYARFMSSVGARLGGRGLLEVAHTEGSLTNAFMIDRGQARFAIVQSDVAQAAAGGEGLFAVTGPLRRIRAVAVLFPEPLHVVVRADSGLTSVAQLAGRRVSLGARGSGTRHSAAQMLAAHGLGADSITEVTTESPADALQRLADGSLDAVVEVVSAPWGSLLRLDHRSGFALLPLEADAIAAIVAGSPAIVPLVIPARTYPGQEQPVQTAGPTALLVASADTPAEVVGWMLDAMFSASDAPGRGVSASRLSRERAQQGVGIPLHEGAAQYFGATAARP